MLKEIKQLCKLWFSRAFLSIREEQLKVCGKVTLIGRDKEGNWLWTKNLPNLITNAGFDLICNVIGLPAQPNEVAWMAIGNGAAGGVTATTLTSETSRQAATYAHTAGTKVFTLTATFTAVVAATEYGCLNAAAAGSLLNVAGFTTITVDSLQIVMTGTLS